MFSKHQEIMNELRVAKKPAVKGAGLKKPSLKGELKAGRLEEERGPAGRHHGELIVSIHDHGDGSFHSEHPGGERVEHPDHLHLVAHLAHHVEPEGRHLHIHHDGFTVQSHCTHENGEHEGTHDHENLHELKKSMNRFLGEEAHEGEDPELDDEDEDEQDAGLSGY